MVLEAYVDASYLGEDGSLTSTTGLYIFLNGHLIHWKSKKQSVGSGTSSCQAEIHLMFEGSSMDSRNIGKSWDESQTTHNDK